MAGIKDIAKKAKVSIATVSYVLNKSNKNIVIGKETTEKVLKIARELNYRPNIIARSLAKQKTYTIGLVIPDLTQPVFVQILKGIATTAMKEGYNTIICDTEDNADMEIRYMETLRKRWVDGIIISGSSTQAATTHIIETERKIPVVGIDREIDGALTYSVFLDNLKGGYEATKYLLELGHRRIGIISSDKNMPHLMNILQRDSGYWKALKEKGIKPDASLRVEGNVNNINGGRKGAKRLLSLKNPPTAIFAVNDTMAIGALQYCLENGLKISEDISIIGFDDTPFASMTNPPLTTMAQPANRMGSAAVNLILSVIAGKNVESKKILEAKLVVRKSCAPPNPERR